MHREECGQKLEQLSGLLFDGLELRKLASSLLKVALAEHGSSASMESTGSMIPLWRSCIRKPVDPKEHEEWLISEVARCLAISFHFANDVYDYYRSNAECDIELRKSCVGMRMRIIERARELYSSHPEAFIGALDRQRIHASRQFAVEFSEETGRSSGFKANEWQWFGELLVECGRLNADVIVPQIASLVVTQEGRLGGISRSFEEERARSLFGDEFIAMLELLGQEISTAGFDEEIREFLAFAAATAKDILRSKGSS